MTLSIQHHDTKRSKHVAEWHSAQWLWVISTLSIIINNQQNYTNCSAECPNLPNVMNVVRPSVVLLNVSAPIWDVCFLDKLIVLTFERNNIKWHTSKTGSGDGTVVQPLTYNPKIEGSNPTRETRTEKIAKSFAHFSSTLLACIVLKRYIWNCQAYRQNYQFFLK